MTDSLSLKVVADADFVCADDFTGIIIKRRQPLAGDRSRLRLLLADRGSRGLS
jgi:hypothetical protein